MTAQTHWADMPLFEGRTSGLPYVQGSEASILAAGRVKQGTVERDKESILQALTTHGGLTDPEITRITGIKPNSERPRRISLTGDGKPIRKRMVDGKVAKRNGKFTIWELTEKNT